MIVRPATAQDHKNLMALYDDFIEKGKFINLDNDSFQEVITSKDNFVLVAEDSSKKLAGLITASTRLVVRYPHPILQVDEFYVDAAFREHGVGTQLIQAVENIARDHNCLRIYIESAYKHKLGHHFYEKNGYDKEGYYFKKVL